MYRWDFIPFIYVGLLIGEHILLRNPPGAYLKQDGSREKARKWMLTIGKAYFSITFTMVLHRRIYGGLCVIGSLSVIARNEAIFPPCHAERSRSIYMWYTYRSFGDAQDDMGSRMSKDCFLVPPRNELCIYPNNKLNFLQIIF